MNKRPMNWHRECLQNMQTNLLRQLDVVRRENEAADRLRRDIIAYDAQIIEADTRGVDGFDKDRFGKKRNGR